MAAHVFRSVWNNQHSIQYYTSLIYCSYHSLIHFRDTTLETCMLSSVIAPHLWFYSCWSTLLKVGGFPFFFFPFMKLSHHLVSCLKLLPTWLTFFFPALGRGLCCEAKSWSELLSEWKMCRSSWLRGTCLVYFRWEHMHQSKCTVMWGMHPDLRNMRLVLGWGELNQLSCHEAILSHEWNLSRTSLGVCVCLCVSFHHFGPGSLLVHRPGKKWLKYLQGVNDHISLF